MADRFSDDDYRALRERMVDEQLARRGIRDKAVLAAMRKVERHRFVPAAMRASAYEDTPLPIGADQTISQPYMVALMTEKLGVGAGDKVLEIGTGSGYQSAILAELGCTVHTVERIEELAERAGALLAGLGYDAVHVHVGDGTLGWPAEAPYRAVLVTAAAPHVTAALKTQLDPDGGVLLIPVGGRTIQELTRVTRHADRYVVDALGGCRFVPLLGREGW